MSHCNKEIPRCVNVLRSHFKYAHGLNTSCDAGVPFQCPECRLMYSEFKTLKRHILKWHPEYKPDSRGLLLDEPETDELIPNETELGELAAVKAEPVGMQMDEIDPVPGPSREPQDAVTSIKADLLKKVKDIVTTFRCDPSLPEAKVQEFMRGALDIVGHCQRYSQVRFNMFFDTSR